MQTDLLRSFGHLLAMGDGVGLKVLLSANATVDDPSLGKVTVDRISELAAQWRDRTGGREARMVAAVLGDDLCVVEWVFDIDGNAGRTQLPVAAAVSFDDSNRIVSTRLYHGFSGIDGRHHLRSPLMACDAAISLPDDAAELLVAESSQFKVSACSAVDDGARYAVEYVVTRHDAGNIAPQPGIAVFERDDSGRLSCVRRYDDIESSL